MDVQFNILIGFLTTYPLVAVHLRDDRGKLFRRHVGDYPFKVLARANILHRGAFRLGGAGHVPLPDIEAGIGIALAIGGATVHLIVQLKVRVPILLGPAADRLPEIGRGVDRTVLLLPRPATPPSPA